MKNSGGPQRRPPPFRFTASAPSLGRADGASAAKPGVHIFLKVEDPAPLDELRPVASSPHHRHRLLGKPDVTRRVACIHPTIGVHRPCHHFPIPHVLHPLL